MRLTDRIALFRKRILSDQGLHSIERCMFEEHEMIRRAATECMCNMMMSEKVSNQSAFDAREQYMDG